MKNYLAKQIYTTLFYPFLFVLFLWIVFFVQINYNYNFYKFGVLPRDSKGLLGIITSVFVHENIGHIASNSIPLLVLGMMLFYFYKKIAKASFLWIWFISGLWLWIGGRNNSLYPNYHIGASTLIYGLATFLFFSGLFRKHLRLMVVSTLVVFLYGSIMWGIFPLKTEISWEGHLFGAIAGVLVAYNYRKEGPQRRVYQWEEEEDENEDKIEGEEKTEGEAEVEDKIEVEEKTEGEAEVEEKTEVEGKIEGEAEDKDKVKEKTEGEDRFPILKRSQDGSSTDQISTFNEEVNSPSNPTTNFTINFIYKAKESENENDNKS